MLDLLKKIFENREENNKVVVQFSKRAKEPEEFNFKCDLFNLETGEKESVTVYLLCDNNILFDKYLNYHNLFNTPNCNNIYQNIRKNVNIVISKVIDIAILPEDTPYSIFGTKEQFLMNLTSIMQGLDYYSQGYYLVEFFNENNTLVFVDKSNDVNYIRSIITALKTNKLGSIRLKFIYEKMTFEKMYVYDELNDSELENHSPNVYLAIDTMREKGLNMSINE